MLDDSKSSWQLLIAENDTLDEPRYANPEDEATAAAALGPMAIEAPDPVPATPQDKAMAPAVVGQKDPTATA